MSSHDHAFPHSPASSRSLHDDYLHSDVVTYCCGTCGYALNLRSSDRDTSGIGAKYDKAIKKGVVLFNSVDDSRFAHVDELRWRPYFDSKRSWGLFRTRTRLSCRNCMNFIGFGYDDAPSSSPATFDGSDSGDSGSTDGAACRRFRVRIGALQPVTTEGSERKLCKTFRKLLKYEEHIDTVISFGIVHTFPMMNMRTNNCE